MSEVPNRLAEALADRYRIERELGQGGMATVYLAHDLKHDRDVAIKVLHADLGAALGGGRFVREIAVTARLNHPHILPLLDSGEAGEFLYYVMPLATGESLADRLTREGRLPVPEAVRLVAEVVEALAHAHAQGVVHRDIKPANILLSGGHALVADFGIAKAVGEARGATGMTTDGVSLGTPVYMAPEQAACAPDIDHRADLYAVGVMLFEMLTGAPPFIGSWQQVVTVKMAIAAPSLTDRCPEAPAALASLVACCMAREPTERPASAGAVLSELRKLADSGSPPRSRGRVGLAVGAVAVVALVALALVYRRDRQVRWVHETALPAIQQLIEADALDSAFALAELAAARAPDDPAVEAAWDLVSLRQTFLSDPAGAVVTRAPVNDTTRWIPVGTTPTQSVRIPNNAWFYRYTKPGYLPVIVMGARLGGSYVPIPSPVPLRPVTDPDTAMVQLVGSSLIGTLYGLTSREPLELANYLMDKLEVTNRQYKAFVDAGGYTMRQWWDSTITREGRPVSWEAAMVQFMDQTGRPGPSTWVGGAPPAGAEELPVGGVSWYEARAYARFVGKELPTVLEWNEAAIPDAARWVVPTGRYESTSPVRGGEAGTVGPRGVYDVAGNVREWAVNAREPGTRYILGGGFSDPAYLFAELYSQPEFDRSAINGIRLIRRLGNGKDLARASAPIPPPSRDVANLRPVDDATFRGFLALYDYDRTPLNPRVESRDTSSADWVREDVTFDLPKGGERMPAVLFLPKRVLPPYQTVVIWPASDAFLLPDQQHLSMWTVDYFVRGGRAVLYPIYEHNYGRGTSTRGDVPSATIEHRDQMIRWATEMRRAIDYASTRADIDTSRLAYVGTSWGGRLGAVMMGVEPRFRTGILNVAGLGATPVRPEEDAVNFLPRVRIPVLMLSGRYDSVFPLESSQQPFFQLLASPPGTKRLMSFDGGHFLPRNSLVAESLAWLDLYLGPVRR